MTFADFIRTRLGFPAVIDYSMASSSLPYDIRRRDYSERLLKEFGLNRQMFSELVPSDQVLGEIGLEVRTELGLPKGVKVVTGGHDGTAAYLGQESLNQPHRCWQTLTVLLKVLAISEQKPILTQKALEDDINSHCNVLKEHLYYHALRYLPAALSYAGFVTN